MMRRLVYIPIYLVLALFLGGCVGEMAKWSSFGSELSSAGMNYVKTDVIAKRQLVREKCWELLMEEVQELRAENKRAEARALLAEAYVPLTILQAIEDSDRSTLTDALNQAHACEVGASSLPEVRPE